MTKFNIHTITSAPEGSKPLLEELTRQVGFTPNLAATMAESPSVLEAFTTLRAINGKGSFTPVEREAIALVVSFENNCTYCMAAHSTFAHMNGIAEDDLRKLRSGQSPATPRLNAISSYARKVVRGKGHVSPEDVGEFLEAGLTPAQLLEVLVVINSTTLANYTHNIARTPIDNAFKDQLWAAAKEASPYY